jgi:hypothetical protein
MTPSSAEVKERVELYFYSPRSAFMTFFRAKYLSLKLDKVNLSRSAKGDVTNLARNVKK